MPVKRSGKTGVAQTKERLSREMRQNRLALFIQQFEKEGLNVTAGQNVIFHILFILLTFVRNMAKMFPVQRKSV